VSKAIEQSQTRVEGYNFDMRKHVLEYDDVVNKQREVIYEQRRRILTEPTLKPNLQRMVSEHIDALVRSFTDGYVEDWDLEALYQAIRRIFPIPVNEVPRLWEGFSREELSDHLTAIAEQAYEEKETRMGAEGMRRIEQLLMLEVLDRRWVRHLTDLDVLREGIGLQAVAQQNPLVAYKKSAFDMFAELLDSIEEDIVTRIYHVEIVKQPRQQPIKAVHPSAGGGSGKAAPQRKAGPRLGRNAPCWCGSGKKYKNCHLKQDAAGGGGGGGNGQQAQPAAQAASAGANRSRGGKKRKSKKRRR
jgi:preprotein translocase subunit SecA